MLFNNVRYVLYYSTQNNDPLKDNSINNVNNIDFNSIGSNEITKNVGKVIKESPTASIDLNVNSEPITAIGEALKVVGNALESYSPVITGTGVAAGTAIIFKTLPPKEREGAMITAGAITGGTAVFSQGIKIIEKTLKDN